MKSLGDAIALRNRLIEHLEEADTECAANEREPLLTFVVTGGGFAGVETIGSINDFLKGALPYYPNLKPEMVRVVLVHPGEFVLPELGEQLGRYTSRKLAERAFQGETRRTQATRAARFGPNLSPPTLRRAVASSGQALSVALWLYLFSERSAPPADGQECG